MFFQNLYENMTLRSDPLGGEDFVSNLQKDPETTGGEKSGSSPFSGETYVDYHGKYTTKLKLFFPQATYEQIEALLYYKKHGMKKEFRKLYNKLYILKPENRNRKSELDKQRKAQKYANDPEFRKRKKEINKRWFAQKYPNDPEFRKRQKEIYKRWFAQKYANDPEYRRKRLEQNRQRRKLKKLGTFNQFVQDKSVSDQTGSL